ncbi:rhodanese-like domain-containing protein [Polaribacter sp. MED152]|uniref:rhodanese-like domain-containing protein n=1 Tax=Polaribacter sp. MED152 TaxID=313598 RepID=UPI000068CD1C|nr:rhodanese-like domain-containing protein [Polaribacter sp. MED152]EAQ43108.1 hypothetical protein MED152_10300 [Polaribacter sp. MED152]
MKAIIRFLLCGLLFISCSSQEATSSISTKELKVLLAKDSIQLLDVRTPEEIKQGAIKTAKFANYFDDDFAAQVTNKFDSQRPIYLYCRSGNRSLKASKLLKAKGFTVVNVLGGYNSWKLENE